MPKVQGAARRSAVTSAAAAEIVLNPSYPYPALGKEPGLPEAAALQSMKDIADWVVFAPSSGRIWFDKQRSLLLHASTFGTMREEIFQALGLDQGAAVLRRIGYAQGLRDAELVRGRWPLQEMMPHFSAGPRLHMLEGFVKVSTLGWKTNAEYGHHSEHIWADSVEAEQHVASFGPSAAPVCFTLVGYAEGYSHGIYDKHIVVEETECAAAGHQHCRAIIRYAEDPRAGGVAATRRETAGQKPEPNPAAANGPLPAGGNSIIGVSVPLVGARHLLEQVAGTQASVLLRGESGVGKELFAKTLHRLSNRRDKPFIAVNCAAIPESLVEAELFGVERGAFTGATASRMGRFERADGGTLFLDEIGLMSMTAQAKLLRALQEQEIERVGGTRPIRVDVRVVAATNADLLDQVRQHRFRPDLFYRLNVFPIDLPPLRSRRNDIPLLIDHFIGFYAGLHNKAVKGLTGAARETLLNYDYPGNIRELQNLIERGVICAPDDAPIDRSHIFRQGESFGRPTFVLGEQGQLQSSEAHRDERKAADAFDSGQAFAMPEQGRTGSLADIERTVCQTALEACAGNVARAARQLGMTRPTLEYRLKKWGIVRRNGGRS